MVKIHAFATTVVSYTFVLWPVWNHCFTDSLAYRPQWLKQKTRVKWTCCHFALLFPFLCFILQIINLIDFFLYPPFPPSYVELGPPPFLSSCSLHLYSSLSFFSIDWAFLHLPHPDINSLFYSQGCDKVIMHWPPAAAHIPTHPHPHPHTHTHTHTPFSTDGSWHPISLKKFCGCRPSERAGNPVLYRLICLFTFNQRQRKDTEVVGQARGEPTQQRGTQRRKVALSIGLGSTRELFNAAPQPFTLQSGYWGWRMTIQQNQNQVMPNVPKK